MSAAGIATPRRRVTRGVRTRTGSRRGRFAGHVVERAGAAAADLDDELRRALDGVRRVGEVDAALEAIAGVAR